MGGTNNIAIEKENKSEKKKHADFSGRRATKL